MLHITNGESAAHGIRDARLGGDVLCWNDVLHEGPVQRDLDEAAFADARVRFIASCGWAPLEEVRAEFARRDARLLLARDDDEVVLWFEHDLYDQLQLIEVLARFAHRGRRPRRVVQVSSNQYLGLLPAEWFRAEFLYREPVSDAAWSEATRAWAAFGGPDPAVLDRLREQTLELPFLGAALTRHLQEFPSMETGLSRFEAQLVDALADGPQDLLAAYHASHHAREEAIFLSDAVFAWHVSRLSRGDSALFKRVDGRWVDVPRDASPAYWEQRILLTPLAERVASGKVDRVKAAGVDRWLGGVHLSGHHVRWRWDERRGRLITM
jgi:hypothetical protein